MFKRTKDLYKQLHENRVGAANIDGLTNLLLFVVVLASLAGIIFTNLTSSGPGGLFNSSTGTPLWVATTLVVVIAVVVIKMALKSGGK